MTVAPIDDAAADPDYGWFFQAVRSEFGWLAECGEQASAFTHFRGLAVQYALPAARVSIEYTPDPGDLRIELVDTSTVDAREELIWNVLAELEPETGWFPWPAQNQLDPSRATAVLSLWAVRDATPSPGSALLGRVGRGSWRGSRRRVGCD